MEYTIRFALKRDGTMIAAPRVTYSSHDVPGTTRDVYRVAIDAALRRRIPLHFSVGMAGADAGRPIAIRFVYDLPSIANKTRDDSWCQVAHKMHWPKNLDRQQLPA
jgi:hypothetical protein